MQMTFQCCFRERCSPAHIGSAIKHSLVPQPRRAFEKKWPFDSSSLPKPKRFRANLSDLFLSGEVAGQRAHSLLADAKAAGAQHVTDLAGNHKPDGNSARDLLRSLRKSSHWPPLYWTDVLVWLDKKQKEDIAQVPFLLPREIVHVVLQWADLDHFADVSHLPTDVRSLLETGKEIIGRNLPLLPLAFGWCSLQLGSFPQFESFDHQLSQRMWCSSEYPHTTVWAEATLLLQA